MPLSSLNLPAGGLFTSQSIGISQSSDSVELDKLQELPLCSCRMETPKSQEIVKLANNKCMATENIDEEFVLWKVPYTYSLCKHECAPHYSKFDDVWDVTMKVDNGHPVDVVYLDFQKAFDKVKDMVALEAVQTLTRMIPGMKGLPYKERLYNLGLYLPEFKRMMGDLIEVYKMLKEIDKVEIEQTPSLLGQSRTRRRGCRVKR
eukprot:g46670.t1